MWKQKTPTRFVSQRYNAAVEYVNETWEGRVDDKIVTQSHDPVLAMDMCETHVRYQEGAVESRLAEKLNGFTAEAAFRLGWMSNASLDEESVEEFAAADWKFLNELGGEEYHRQLQASYGDRLKEELEAEMEAHMGVETTPEDRPTLH